MQIERMTGCLLLVLTALLGVLAFTVAARAEEEPVQMYVVVSESSWLNGRYAPSKASSEEAYFYRGDIVDVYEVQDGWARVKGGECGYVWCCIDFLSSTAPDTKPEAYTVTANGRVRVRETPGGGLARWAQDGDTVTVTRWCGQWAYVGDGYIDGHYLKGE